MLKKRPPAFWALALFVFSIPLEEAILIPGVGTISRALGIVALALTIGYQLRGSRGGRPTAEPMLVLTAFTLWSCLTYFWAVDKETALIQVFTLVQIIGMVWMLYEWCSNRDNLALAIQAYLSGSVVAAGWVIITFLASTQPTSRVVIDGFGASTLAFELALGLPAAIVLGARMRTAWLTAWLLYLPIAWIALLLIASRGGIVTGLVAMTMGFIVAPELEARKRRALALLVMLSFIVPVMIAPEASLDRVSSIPQEVTGDSSLNNRTLYWQASIDAFGERPARGFGLGSASRVIGDRSVLDQGAHNVALQILVERGSVGLLLISILFVVLGWRIRRLDRIERRYWAIVLATMITSGMVLHWDTQKAPWLFLGFIIAATSDPARYGRSETRSGAMPFLTSDPGVCDRRPRKLHSIDASMVATKTWEGYRC